MEGEFLSQSWIIVLKYVTVIILSGLPNLYVWVASRCQDSERRNDQIFEGQIPGSSRNW